MTTENTKKPAAEPSKVHEEITKSPCDGCKRGAVEGCTMADYPKYGERCIRLAAKKIFDDEESEEARGKQLGLFRNRHEMWCIKDPRNGKTVSGKSPFLDVAIHELSNDPIIAGAIRSAEHEAEVAATKARKAARECEKPTASKVNRRGGKRAD